jgi:hypothetical protein
MIMDFQFLSASQIACSAQRKVRGSAVPCIDIYDIPNTDWLVSARLDGGTDPCFNLRNWPSSVCLVASFQLPRLRFSRIGCVWSRQNRHSNRILEFALVTPRASTNVPLQAQVITFRLEGQVGSDGVEVIQGVISISKLQTIIQKAAASKSQEVPTAVKFQRCNDGQELDPAISEVALMNEIYPGQFPGQLGYDAVFIEWNQWSPAASIHKSQSSTAHESRGTQVAHIARSRLDKAKAVLVIRDYSQQLLFAPPGHMTRKLGCPTENRDSADLIPSKPIPTRTFTAKTGHKSLASKMFGPLNSGSGYRERTIELGQYGPPTASARLFWHDDKCLSVANHVPGVRHFAQMRAVC